MREIDNIEMSNVNGGSAGWVVAGIIAGITFIIGIFSGYTNPNKCNS